MPECILVPLDGSSFGEHALAPAIGLARRFDASLELVHVHEVAPAVYMEGVPQLDTSLELDGIEHDRHYLESARDRVAALGLPVRTSLLDGPTVAALVEHLQRTGCDLIVMTTHGRGPLSRAWLGSVADGLARHSDLPLLMIRPDPDRDDGRPPLEPAPPLRRALVPLDGSPEAERVTEHALRLIGPERGEILFLHVVSPTLIVGGHVFELSEQRREELTAVARERIGDVVDRYASRCETHLEVVVARDAARAILDAGTSAGADFIAMSTHGRGGLSRLLFGSVTDKVLRSSSLPLLVARPVNGEKGAPGRAA